MLKILAISDIEDNRAAVELLLNDINPLDYDCAVLTGDIGPEIISWVMEQICILFPVFYIYGNHEHSLEYATQYAPNAHHVHNCIHDINGYYISGFSGCPANWGRNPIYLNQFELLDRQHATIITQLSDLNSEHELEKNEFECMFDISNTIRLRMEYSERTKVGRETRAIMSKWGRMLDSQNEALSQLTETGHYQAFLKDRKQAFKNTLHINKQSLFEMLVVEQQIDMRKTILLTHEKFTCLNDYFPVPALMNVYGHTRPHCHKFWRKTHFVNASALDNNPSFYNLISGTPKGDEPGTYATISIDRQEISVKFIELSQSLPHL
jgi:hypothetical protein